MALNAYLSLKGQKQGQIKGGVMLKGREGQVAVIAFDHEIISPRDPSSGLPTGKRQHRPLVITKEIDKSSPLLAKALTTNETLTEFTLRFYAPEVKATSGTGQEVNNYTIKLTNATIASISTDMLNNKMEPGLKMGVLEQIAFTYQKIEWTWMDGGITATDDWEAANR